MTVTVRRIVLKTPSAAGAMGQFSALERCRGYASSASDAAASAQASSSTAQGAGSVAVAAKDAALASVGAVKVTQDDAVPAVLDASLSVTAPLSKSVLSPGGDESISLSVAPLAGATTAGPGASGVVPAPQAGEQLKFLRGDATWQALDRNSLSLTNVEDTWSKLGGPVTVLSAKQAAVAGNWLDKVLPGGAPGRAIKPDQPEGSGYVASAAYDVETGGTMVVVEGVSLTAQCTELWIGQDPRNAPSSSSAGSDLYLAETFYCLMY